MVRLACLLSILTATGCGPSHEADTDAAGGEPDASASIDGAAPPDAGDTSADAGGDGGVSGCNPRDFTLQQGPAPEVYLVVDRSGSMNDPGANPPATIWDELNGAVDAALTQFESSIEFGLLMYPSGSECGTSGPQVGVGPEPKTPIINALSETTPAGGTPTAAALNNAASSLTDLGAPDSPKFIILATDGGPNCNYFLSAQPSCSCTYASSPEYCCTSHPDSCIYGYQCLDDDNSLSVITDLHDNQGIDTFVIGLVGTDEYESLLNQMAIAGGRPQIGGATDYYAAGNEAELAAALQEIAGATISCTLELEEAPEDPDGVKVYLDGSEVPRDGGDGWDYTDGTHTAIELHGAACETLQDGDEHTVTATFPCVVD